MNYCPKCLDKCAGNYCHQCGSKTASLPKCQCGVDISVYFDFCENCGLPSPKLKKIIPEIRGTSLWQKLKSILKS